MDISLESLEKALGIRKQMVILEKRLAALLGNTFSSNSVTPKGRGRMSASARAKIAASARARWAKRKAGQPNGAVKSPARKGGISAAGRRKLSQMMKARWAARRKAAAKK